MRTDLQCVFVRACGVSGCETTCIRGCETTCILRHTANTNARILRPSQKHKITGSSEHLLHTLLMRHTKTLPCARLSLKVHSSLNTLRIHILYGVEYWSRSARRRLISPEQMLRFCADCTLLEPPLRELDMICNYDTHHAHPSCARVGTSTHCWD